MLFGSGKGVALIPLGGRGKFGFAYIRHSGNRFVSTMIVSQHFRQITPMRVVLIVFAAALFKSTVLHTLIRTDSRDVACTSAPIVDLMREVVLNAIYYPCLLYTSDAADE